MGGLLGKWVRTITIGALALAPLALTVWVIWMLIRLAAYVGGLVGDPVLNWLSRNLPIFHEALERPLVAETIELVIALAVLTIAGLFAGNVFGRLLGNATASLMQRIPIAGMIYSSARQLIRSFQSPAEAAKKVVLIEFPTEHMKTVGLVTREFRAEGTGEALAAVYVPTTPNPTSGYVEIVPSDRLVWLDWSTSDAIQFIVSGGVTAPDTIRYRNSAPGEGPTAAPSEAPDEDASEES